MDNFSVVFNSDHAGSYFTPDAEGWVRGSVRFDNPFLNDDLVAVLAVHVGPEYLVRVPSETVNSRATGARMMGQFYAGKGDWLK